MPAAAAAATCAACTIATGAGSAGADAGAGDGAGALVVTARLRVCSGALRSPRRRGALELARDLVRQEYGALSSGVVVERCKLVEMPVSYSFQRRKASVTGLRVEG